MTFLQPGDGARIELIASAMRTADDLTELHVEILTAFGKSRGAELWKRALDVIAEEETPISVRIAR